MPVVTVTPLCLQNLPQFSPHDKAGVSWESQGCCTDNAHVGSMLHAGSWVCVWQERHFCVCGHAGRARATQGGGTGEAMFVQWHGGGHD